MVPTILPQVRSASVGRASRTCTLGVKGGAHVNKGYTMIDSTVSRRGFVTVAAGAAALGTAAVRPAFADEAARTFADTVEWAAEYDVVVLGMGFSGLVSAMAAADEGATVLICEKASDMGAGGNSKICGRLFAWTQGDVEAARDYYTALAAGRAIPEDMLEILVNGIAGMGDTLSEKYGLDASVFTNQKIHPAFGFMSPEYPEKPGSEAMGLWSSHEDLADSFLYQSMRDRLAADYADKVDVWFETPGVSLIQDPADGTVLGVSVNRRGEARNVCALNGVCVCTGGFERIPAHSLTSFR